MHIPHTICPNAQRAYEPSTETLALAGEAGRTLCAENFTWDENYAPSLVTVCVRALVENFTEKQVLDELPTEDLDLLHETLPTDLPLTLTVPLISADIYWQRSATARWTSNNYVKAHGGSWKRLYLERHVSEYIETLTPEDYNKQAVIDLMTLCSSHVSRLCLRQLQVAEAAVDTHVRRHIDLHPVINHLAKLKELDIVFGIRECGMDFAWNLFQFTQDDCKNLGQGIENSKKLKIFRLHRSNLDNALLTTLLQYIAKNKSLRVLDFSHCKITDGGALALAKVLTVHPTLATINLCNNKIGTVGAQGLAYALINGLSPLVSLNLRLNMIGDGGATDLAAALALCSRPREMILAGCGIKEAGAIKMAQMFSQNTALHWLDLSNNHLGEDGGEGLFLGLQDNVTLLELDIRKTGITLDCEARIRELLVRNNDANKKKAKLFELAPDNVA